LGGLRIYGIIWVSRYAAKYLIWPMHMTTFACATGYRGKNCEENIDDCPGNLCQNGATCVDDINRYSCLCPPTYVGELCEQDVDECGQRPSVCQNGATCTNSIGGFSCICVNGWAGPDCSVNIDDCAGAACFNGATCIDRVGSFYCRCTPGKTGKERTCRMAHMWGLYHVLQS
jgi:Notch-like protein